LGFGIADFGFGIAGCENQHSQGEAFLDWRFRIADFGFGIAGCENQHPQGEAFLE
jgi:hypothetical protein